ncbi:MAG: nitrate reductase molybdenum cofactor assembly chaperone [Actinobacteria bacterium]|nr:nitrate reductase molybdenum cofactor assembly chaperone [Actinomycetota bacterium]
MDAEVMEIAALMLRFPDDDVLAARGEIAAAARDLPASDARELLVPATEWWAAQHPDDLRAEYVRTFDMSRRTSLDLTYVTYGDRRQRGIALLAFRHRYREAGFEPDGTELADHLPMALELAGTGHPIGEEMLRDNLPVIELLRLALEDAGSPFASVVGAVTSALPPLTAEELQIVRDLAAEGPPTESIGLAPFGPPEVMPEPIGGCR